MLRKLRHIAFAIAAIGTLGLAASTQAITMYGPIPYAGVADSPLTLTGPGVYAYLEDFEDGWLNTPGVTASAGMVLHPGPLTDSVDADDGVMDGLGTAGRSWYSAGHHAVEFIFDATVLGWLPTQAGIVWTDVGYNDFGGLGYGHVLFEAFDSYNNLLGAVGPIMVGDGLAGGWTAEDRFFGIVSDIGIKRIRLTMPDSTDWEMDHLQYGKVFGIPEPATAGLGLLALATASAAALRRRR